MKALAAILERAGDPLIFDEVVLGEPRDGEVLVRMVASGVCATQLHHLMHPPAAPMLLGHEASGVVEAVGPGVTELAEGMPVLIAAAPVSRPGQPLPPDVPWQWRDGTHVAADQMNLFTWSTHSVLNQRYLTPVLESLPWESAAVLGCAGVTGCGSVTRIADLKEGESAAVFGVGGVGLCSVVAARRRGASEIIAIDIDDERLEFARRFGATQTVNCRDSDVVEAVRDLTGGGVDYTFETSGVSTLEAIHALRPATVGAGSGGLAVIIAAPRQAIQLDIRETLRPGRRLAHSYAGNSHPREDLREYARWYAEGDFPLEELVTARSDLRSANEAVARLRDGQVLGRSILTMS